MSKAPAYQMYASDWLGSRSVRFMDDYQRGWYIQLLNEAWDSDPQCMLPDNDELLQKLAGISAHSRAIPDFNDRWLVVRRMFKQHGEFVANDRQMEEFAKQEMRRKQARDAGRSSAAKRAEEAKAIIDQHIDSATTVERPLNDRCKSVERKSNPPIPTPTPVLSPVSNSKSGRASKPAPLYRWDEFAALYPPDKLIPDAKAKAWWRKHVTTDEQAGDVLAGTRAWVGSRQYQDGFGYGCCRFLTEEIWAKPVPQDRKAKEEEKPYCPWEGAL